MSSYTHWDTIKGLGCLGAFVFAQITETMLDKTLSRISVVLAIAVSALHLWNWWKRGKRSRMRRKRR